jgi:hypothetical protein
VELEAIKLKHCDLYEDKFHDMKKYQQLLAVYKQQQQFF